MQAYDIIGDIHGCNNTCTDYSVAKPGGILDSCCWDGEQRLDNERFVSVDRIE